MRQDHDADAVARLSAAIREALAQADTLGLLEVGIYLEQARLAAATAAGRPLLTAVVAAARR